MLDPFETGWALVWRSCFRVATVRPNLDEELFKGNPRVHGAGGPAWTERLPVRFEWLAAA
jgi:hypothetical protein